MLKNSIFHENCFTAFLCKQFVIKFRKPQQSPFLNFLLFHPVFIKFTPNFFLSKFWKSAYDVRHPLKLGYLNAWNILHLYTLNDDFKLGAVSSCVINTIQHLNAATLMYNTRRTVIDLKYAWTLKRF